jgi:hypothetical protein
MGTFNLVLLNLFWSGYINVPYMKGEYNRILHFTVSYCLAVSNIAYLKETCT